jgi:HJR/Mrr/RecB family endonuclease
LEVVSLDEMDWFEFEQFVAHLFEQLGIGKAEEIRKGRDAGKDIILSSPQGLIIVECKHHPKGSVGRPVVQKLHSAAITSSAREIFSCTALTTSSLVQQLHLICYEGGGCEVNYRTPFFQRKL